MKVPKRMQKQERCLEKARRTGSEGQERKTMRGTRSSWPIVRSGEKKGELG